MFNRKNVALAATLLAGLLVAYVLVAFIDMIDHRTETTNSLTASRVEMMPETSPEFRRVHYTGPDGKDLKVEIAYRNNDYGYLFYREDGTQREFLVVFPNRKTERIHSYFDITGKVVTSGFEVRKDGSKVWTAEQPVPGGDITTTTYWQDGKTVFSTAVRSKDRIETTFFKKDTTQPWVRLVTSLSGDTVYAEDVYGDNGKLVRSRKTDDGYSGTVEYYRADGTLNFRQTWERQYYGGYDYDGYGGPGGYGGYSPTPTLKSVTVFGADGKTATLEVTFSYPGSVATWDKKGTKIVRYLKYDGTVDRVEYVSASGSTTTNNRPTGNEAKVPSYNETELKVDMPKPVDTRAEWKAAEDAFVQAMP